MSYFEDKRDSLEKFVKEQIIGPGAYNKRFFFLSNWSETEFFGKRVKLESAFDNINEIIPEVPAYQYSSGILFPETKELLESPKLVQPTIDKIEEVDDSSITINTEIPLDDDNCVEDTFESVVSKQQNYPNLLGLSFVVDKTVDIQNDLTISVSFRKYKHIKKNECYDRKIAVWVPEYEDEIEKAINHYFGAVFYTEKKDDNLFVLPKDKISGDVFYEIDYKYLNQYIEEQVLCVLKNTFKDDLKELSRSKDNVTTYYGLESSYNRQLYSVSLFKEYSKTRFENVTTLFDDSIVDYIKEQLEVNSISYSTYKELIKELEIYNQLKSVVTDLKSVFKDNQPTPIWKSEFYQKNLLLPSFDLSKKIYRSEKQVSIDEDDVDLKDLKFSVQYIAKKDKVFVKILLINKNFIELKPDEPKQLNKKNEANKKSFFGVKLEITEKSENCLQQYNPPQLLDFDEEDSFNKLIYRNYVDYGEGYNTSVIWGKKKGLNYISTDFLPAQETPDVGVTPSKINVDKVVRRIEDDQMLSMRYLSTLTVGKVSDEEVLNGLDKFVDAYGGANGWIEEKQSEVAKNDENLDDKSLILLSKQLKACENDFNRLKRNIELLRKNKKALVAFRTMNTAMFMQLHHSLNIKKSKIYIPKSNSDEYYKNLIIKDDRGQEFDYKWRPFQLGFILLNIDAFVRPDIDDDTVVDVFGSGWPERNEIADLVWFPTGGGKTEAYLGIIAFNIALRRFTKGVKGNGTTVLMRYTLRMLTLQQFQRATLLICALEAIRKENFKLPNNENLGNERITIGLFVGSGSLPNYWDQGEKSMINELKKISKSIETKTKISTSLPFTECPWCGGKLFVDKDLPNIKPNHTSNGKKYKIEDQFNIACNSVGCTFKGRGRRSTSNDSLPLRLFDEDIYKFPPTLLFGTVDKFASLANKISTTSGGRNQDSRRLVGKGYKYDVLPPELIIQDELHLLLGPLGSSVGLFEKSIDSLCTYIDEKGNKLKPKIVTSTATTRNTDKQIFALFNRRSEIFPKQGIFCDDSFFAFYKRKNGDVKKYDSNRKYIGVLPIGKTQVWMQLRVAAITLTHRLKYLKEKYSCDSIFENPQSIDEFKKVFDYYHTILSYFNSLKDVGKTQSQLSHYLPGDINYVTKNTTPWSFIDKLIRKYGEIKYSELTGRLSGEEVKTNLADIEKKWSVLSSENGMYSLSTNNPPEFVIATNMISVGIDVSRFNTMIISSMPRNIAEYIQASSRVARDKEGIVFTIHHPFRSRDISHYQKFKEFHEKFYSYVEPISVTPFASKALDRYLAMYAIVLIRHCKEFELVNNDDASNIDEIKVSQIKKYIKSEIDEILDNAKKLESYLVNKDRPYGLVSSIDGIISEEESFDLMNKLNDLLESWCDLSESTDSKPNLKYRNNLSESMSNSLFVNSNKDNNFERWKVSHSLREIGASTVIKTVQQ